MRNEIGVERLPEEVGNNSEGYFHTEDISVGHPEVILELGNHRDIQHSKHANEGE